MSLIAGNLGAVQQLLDEAGWRWGVCSGAAAYVYGVRRPIANIDILLPPGFLRQMRDLLAKKRFVAQYDGRVLLWRGIKLFDDLGLVGDQHRHPFVLDEEMGAHLRRLPLLGSRVLVLAPEDVVVQKALLALYAEKDPTKSHRQDLQMLLRAQASALDREYLQRRMRLCLAEAPVNRLLEELSGIASGAGG
ncbi:MAG: hypothetical protein ACP5SI_08690 [Chloroflexia bacterium]